MRFKVQVLVDYARERGGGLSALPRLVKQAPPPLPPELEARIAHLVEREVERRMSASANRLDGVLAALYRACIGVARAINPHKPWDKLRD